MNIFDDIILRTSDIARGGSELAELDRIEEAQKTPRGRCAAVSCVKRYCQHSWFQRDALKNAQELLATGSGSRAA
jgi:hypothetical protein